MKKQFALMATLWMVLANAQSPALADDWYNKYDRNHDNHWNYNEFRSAHNDYWKAHKDEKRMNDAELRHEFDRRAGDHHDWVDNEGVRDFHHW